MKINWPDTLDESSFLQNYWQQQPLLLKQAFPSFINPLDPNELAGLACDPDANARFMQKVDGDEWRMCSGPLTDDFFDDISGHQWSLLVSDIEKLLPDFRTWLEPFRFLPDWRIDDLMISYAPVGGSVGAHVDQYDVFLLQADGIREWQIEHTARQGHQPSVSSSISLLGDFNADSTMRLHAGDMLYLPPGFAHHGIAAEEPCMTWSIGFRAPTAEEMLPSILRYLCDDAGDNPILNDRFSDRQRQLTDNPGHISTEDMKQMRNIVRRALAMDDATLDACIGRYLTEPVVSEHYELPEPIDWHTLNEMLNEQATLVCNSQVKFATIEHHRPATDKATAKHIQTDHAPIRLLVDGDIFDCSNHLGYTITTNRTLNSADIQSDTDRDTVLQLVNRQHLIIDNSGVH